MREATTVPAVEEAPSTFYVEIPVTQRGRAVPPLYDGYRELFQQMTTVRLSGNRTRRVTDRIRNCAARMLCFLNYQLARVPRPEDGIRYSRSHFQDLFRGDYGLDSIEVAQAVLIASGLVLEPEQEDSTDRAFCWRVDAMRLRQAFAHSIPTPLPQSKKEWYVTNKPRVALVPPGDVAPTQPSVSFSTSTTNFHEQKSYHGHNEIPVSLAGFQEDHTQISGDGSDDICVCNKKKQREFQEKRDHSSILPHEKHANGRGENRASPEIKQGSQHKFAAPEDAEEIINAFEDAPNTPETVLAFFDRLRGYQLTGKLLQAAHEHAHQLCYGNEDTRRPGYPLQVILLTTVYLLKYDPTWQEHYERYCGRTGIPDVWAVNKWIGAKWPLALRRLLETGAYVGLDDGTLLSRVAYQAMLEREQDEWQREHQMEEEVSELTPVQSMEERVRLNERHREHTEAVGQEAKHGAAPLEAAQDAEPEGFPTSYVATLHANRLRRVLPPYFQVEVQPVRDNVFQLVITNSCAEDDVTVLTCNQQVCEALRVIQEERATGDQVRGWSLPSIAEWWRNHLQRKLSPELVVEIQTLEELRFGIIIKRRLSQGEHGFLVANNRQAEEVLAHGMNTAYVQGRSPQSRP